MSKVGNLLSSYQEFIALPWATGIASSPRVIFGVYDPADELKLRAMIDNFEIATKEAHHDWLSLDIEKSFSEWIVSMKYKHKYFQRPELISSILERFAIYLEQSIKSKCSAYLTNSNAVIAIYGLGSLYGLMKVSQLVEMLAPSFYGRLLVFFPGSNENNNYRLLNGYDGWNYRAIVLNK